MVDNNEEQFMELLRNFAPDLYMIKKTMLDQNIYSTEVIEVLRKIGIVKSLDDGYGKIVAEIKPIENKKTNTIESRVWMVRMEQDRKIDFLQ